MLDVGASSCRWCRRFLRLRTGLCPRSRCRWIEAVFEQGGDVVLDLLKLIEVQVGVNDRKDVAGRGLLVNENAVAVALELLFDFEQALAFEHDGQNICGGDVTGVVQFDELAQQ